ncbi:MAG TPA: hypothetical protein VLB50_12995 [Ignavibacteriaceae bacterium]|nr:hypothetical protein [Ignavibacteriaceae bacterium]
MDPFLRVLEIFLLIAVPVLIFFVRSNWQKLEINVNLILLPFIWYLTYAPIHELSHIIGYSIAGVEVTGYRLMTHFLEGDYGFSKIQTATALGTDWKSLVILSSPYIFDLIFVLIGFLLFKQIKLRNSFLAGLIFLLFCLRPFYDFVDNYIAVFYSQSDITIISRIIGEPITYIFGIVSIGFILLVNLIILGWYKNYPDT